MNKIEPFKLPENFLMGTATSATQIESGDRNNSWYYWTKERRTKDSTISDNTTDHYQCIDEDISLQKKLNMQTYRFSIEWSRIAPEKGALSDQALLHYKDEVEKLINAGITPLITLHHFSNPIWIENNGAWLNPETVKYFLDYTEFVVRNLRHLVSDWCTFNEPNTYLFAGYLHGKWPPGEQYNLGAYFTGANNFIRAHAQAYSKIHEIRKSIGFLDTKVGFALHMRIFKSKNNTPLEKLLTKYYDYWFQRFLNYGLINGMTRTLSGFRTFLGKHARYCEYLGINYYTRDVISFVFRLSTFFGKQEKVQHSSESDLGWEIYPKGIYTISKSLFRKYKMPIYITENGLADESDKQRKMFIFRHLQMISKLCEKGVDVQRYYHWSLLDNFEWMEGMIPKFGLIAVDHQTKERRIRDSAFFYADVINNKGVTQDMIEQYFTKNQQ